LHSNVDCQWLGWPRQIEGSIEMTIAAAEAVALSDGGVIDGVGGNS
jgi:hypothetical protein